MDYVFMIGYLIGIAIMSFIIFVLYTWVDTMEKDGCDCSYLWHKDIVKFGFMFLLAYNLVIMIIISANPKVQFLYIFKFIGAFLGITYWAIVLDYIVKLKELACGCSEDWKREFAYIYSIIYFVFLLFSVLMGLIAFFILKLNLKENAIKK